MWEGSFLPFGEEENPQMGVNHYKFTSKERDQSSGEAGLDYFGARYYASTTARFLSVDPTRLSIKTTDPQTWNRYTYVLNKPLSFVDPNGKWLKSVHREMNHDLFDGLLTPKQVEWINKASDAVDDGDQSAEGAYIHGMSRGEFFGPGQKPWEAEQAFYGFIAGQLQLAVEAQMDWEGMGGEGYSDRALYEIGKGVHAVQDSHSPRHRGFQPWLGVSVFNPFTWVPALYHGVGDAVAGGTADEARHAAMIASYIFWDQFQKRLEEERRKKKKSTTQIPKASDGPIK
jgi:RHS repeat-associated protein